MPVPSAGILVAMKPLFRSSLVVVVVAMTVLAATPAFAAEPADVASGIRDDGVYVESGSDLSESEAGELVATVRNQGERFSIVVLTQAPVGGAVAFGDAVVDRLGDPGLIFVLTPDDVAVVGVGEIYDLDEIDAALDVAADRGGSDGDYVSNFVSELTGVAVVAPTPDPITTTVPEPGATSTPAGSSSGGGSGFLWFILIVGGLGLFIFWMLRRSRRQQGLSTENELAAARAEIQLQIDAVANDILDMEDEVRMADNDRVDTLYNAAGETFRDASEALAEADTPKEFLDITNDLETAIWQLDSAEALLDGKAPPPQPKPKRPEPVAAPSPSPRPSAGTGGGLGVPPRPTYPKGGYDRRPTRRSRGMSPSLIEMLITLGAGALANRSRRPRTRRAPTRTTSRTSSRTSDRSGGGFLPSPSRKGTRTSRSSRSTRSSPRSSRRGTGGRIRTGRKRRK